ncbi:MAG: tryptophan--tRNA ligase [Peptococcaceae bacterium]|nr:tryptophan--tRNA ligase [Peptococcaceae bacterium]
MSVGMSEASPGEKASRVFRQRILSGMRPTGPLHIGHLSVLQNWVRLQREYECFFAIADWHALTTAYDEKTDYGGLASQIALDWLSVGLDPKESAIFLQSRVSEHAELFLALAMIAPLSWLERVPSYKDQLQQLGNVGKDLRTFGFLGYPLLQAADIMLYKAHAVPVGEDQLPHIELCREIVRRFNYMYEEVFPEPQGLVGSVPLLPGVDGRKMSKSYNNAIAIAASTEEIKGQVRMMITDPARLRKDDLGHPEVCVVHKFHQVYSPDVSRVEEACRGGRIGCVACKAYLAENLDKELAPYRAKRLEWKEPGLVEQALKQGEERARQAAAETMDEVRRAMGLVRGSGVPGHG